MIASSGPFRVTSPNTAVSWSGLKTVTWNVAGTNTGQVATANVNILLSTDGGNTFPTVLASATPNDGSQSVAMPSILTTTARIKVEAVGNIFFDVSDTNFSITPSEYVMFGDADVAQRQVYDNFGNGNNNYLCDPGETTVHLRFYVRNQGTIAATGVTATLRAMIDGTTVEQGVSAYPDLAPMAYGVNATDFVISVDPAVLCGSLIPLQLTVTSAQGSNTIDYSQIAGQPGSTLTYPYNGLPVAIPDSGTVDVPFTVGSAGIISDVNFRFDGASCSTTPGSATVGLDHTYVGDLVITLISPAGTQVVLANRSGGGGNNFCATVFDDDGSYTSIQNSTASQAPFTGTWLPASPLSAFDGQNPAGTWILRVQDAAAADTGTVREFSLIIAFVPVCEPPVALADFNRDHHVDDLDFEHFAACFTGPLNPLTDQDCFDADLDPDGDVDESDFGVFQQCISGPTVEADPNCAG